MWHCERGCQGWDIGVPFDDCANCGSEFIDENGKTFDELSEAEKADCRQYDIERLSK